MRVRHCIVLCILFVHIPALPLQSAEITVTPSVSLKGEYNDNIDFSETDRIDDYIGTLSPALNLSYGIDRFSINSQAGGDFICYARDTTRNENRGRFGLDAAYQMLERLTVTGKGEYARDTTLDSLLEETGIVERRSVRDNYRAGGGLSLRITETSRLMLNYNYSRNQYELREFADSEKHNIDLAYEHTFNDGRDTMTVSPYYGQNVSDRSTTDDYGLSVGVNHTISETLRAAITAGVRYAIIDSASPESEEDWGWTAKINLGKSWQRIETNLGYSRDLDFSAEGETVEVNRFSLTATAMLAPRLDLQCSGSLYFTKTIGAESERDRRHVELSPSLLYRLTQNHSLKLLYAYGRQNDRTLEDDRTMDRHRVFLILTFNFPMRV